MRPGSASKADGSDETPVNEEVTLTRYDANGNVTDVQTPRGSSEAAEDPDAEPFTTFTEHTTYDPLDRPTAIENAAGEVTTRDYDGAGNVVLERRPKGNVGSSPDDRYATRSAYDGRGLISSQTDGLGQRTTFSYDRNGNRTKVEAPGARPRPGAAVEPRVTETTYDGRDLPWAQTSGAGTDRRTSVSEFDGNGNLRREVKPGGVEEATRRALVADPGGAVEPDSPSAEQAAVHEYTPDDLLATRHLPWGDRDAQDAERYRQSFHRDARGWLTALDSIAGPGEAPATTRYTHYDSGWIETQDDPTLPGQDPRQKLTYDYDARGLQKLWSSDRDREMRRDYYPSGQLKKRTAEEPAPGGGRRTRTYYYGYNENRSRVQMRDEDLDRTTDFHYDEAERETAVDERWGPQGDLPAGKDTLTEYDADGNVELRRTDGIATFSEAGELTDYDGGKRTDYAYDPLDRETTMTVDQAGAEPRTTSSAYHPSGELERRTKPNGVVDFTGVDTRGELSHMRRAKAGQDPVKDQPYAYDRNGNRASDERGGYAFNARDQLTSWTKPGATAPEATYELNGSGAVTRQTQGGVTEERTYTGDQLVEARSGSMSREFKYDDFGNMEEEWQQQDGQASALSTRYSYDAFERLTAARGAGQGSDTSYAHDGLDRTDYRSEAGTRYDSSYVGTSEALSREEDPGRTQLYDYDSAGEGQGQASAQGGQSTYRSFAKDANGSVEGLEDQNGAMPQGASYDYDPYGSSRVEPSDQAAASNPMRFQGHRYDSGLKLYDMQARTYRPDVGRFLTQDRFEASAGDLSLQSDPLTQNRYAFAGGNPVSRVEWDGHQTRSGCAVTQVGGVRDCPGPRGRARNSLKIGRRVSVVDSFGGLIGTITRTGRASFRVVRGGRVTTVRRRRGLVFSTRSACGPSSRAFAGIDVSLRRGVNKNLQIRGFVRRDALNNPRGLGPARPCVRPQGQPVDPSPLAFRNPGFHPFDQYRRTGGRAEEGDRYGFYGPGPTGDIYLSASTTNVRRGGVPVAVVNARRDRFVRTGYFTNCDINRLPNPENMNLVPIVSWSFGYVQRGARRLYGWVPTQALATTASEPPLTGC